MNKNNITKEQLAMVQNAMKHAKDVLCECGGGIFNQANKLKRISKFYTGEDSDRVINIPVLICNSCSLELSLEEIDNNQSALIT